MGVLSTKAKQILLVSGFLPSEIRKFNEAKAPDGSPQDLKFNSAPFQKMIESRKRWTAGLKKKGWTTAQIRGKILDFYKLKAGRSPFDFLKLEYRPPKKLTDYQFAIKMRTRVRTDMTLGKRYGPAIRKQERPDGYKGTREWPNK